MKLFGIPNCGTVNKARGWPDEHDVDYEFCDFKKQGVTESLLSGWLRQVGWKKLLKKTGPTWGQLPDAVKGSVNDDASAMALMLEKPNVIKRPVLEHKGKVLANGFSGQYDENLFARFPHPNPLPEPPFQLSPTNGRKSKRERQSSIPAGEGANEKNRLSILETDYEKLEL